MRTSVTAYRGPVALIFTHTGQAYGVAELRDSLPVLDAEAFRAARDRHAIPPDMDEAVLRDGWVHPWVLGNVRRLREPVTVGQRPSAVIWVTLAPDVVAAIRERLLPDSGTAYGQAA